MKDCEIKRKIFNIATDVFRDTQVLFAYLYGSYAVDQAHPFSDLDIALYVPRLSQREKLDLELTLALEIDKKLKQGPASDVRIINSLPLAVAGKVITEGLLIYCRDDEARIDYETILRSAYFDFLPFIHSYQRTYLEQIAVQSDTKEGLTNGFD
jgi:predicted nucleotidyltransferase